ncbi:uncharacterized protein LOC120208142 [Hibiscus syriacus]|uniref:uncharacterized protein LOC120208142 n=1 Tax=Hibiscus syriacus TaxID=106335 RepID=UPI0019216278|nr:uncharacterized protein LOC120208142 [Hibiscus syriacus]
MASPALTGRPARWQMLLSEFDIIYVSQKVIKGSVIANFLASRSSEDYESLNFNFPKRNCGSINFPRRDLLSFHKYIGILLHQQHGRIRSMHHEVKSIKMLKVYGDSSLVMYQLRGEWDTKEPKLIGYQNLVLELLKEFEDVTFKYLPRENNQMDDALATLAAMFKANKNTDMMPIRMQV